MIRSRKSTGRRQSVGSVFALIAAVSLIIGLTAAFSPAVSKAAAKSATGRDYGVIVAGEDGNYTYYDLNSESGKAGLELSPSGNLMIPLKKFCGLIPELTYQYDSVKKQATVTNTENGKVLVYPKNSSQCVYYSKKGAKGVKKDMTYKMYVSKDSNSVMVHMASLKWVMGNTKGYLYSNSSAVMKQDYNPDNYAVVAYNPYGTAELVKAGEVQNYPYKTVPYHPLTVKVTIPEGYSAVQIFERLVKYGVTSSVSDLVNACNEYDFSYYPLVAEIPDDVNSCYRLEGYLYPDTYEFYRNSKPQDALGVFLRNAEKKITDADKERAEELGFSIYEVLTIASLIEKETGNSAQMSKVSSVIHNRLEAGMKLQLDAASQYVERYIKPYISGDRDRFSADYNTYKCAALPAGPVCSPGRSAINAALYPAETDYLFFASGEDGTYYYAADYGTHLENLVKAGLRDAGESPDEEGETGNISGDDALEMTN